MKKICNFALSILVTIMSVMVLSPISAWSLQQNEDERIKELCAKAKELNIEKEVRELKDMGMSSEDAEYYVRLNNLVKLLERENIEVLIDDDLEDISDSEFSMNKQHYREKILEGDKRAIKKAMKSLDSLINGAEYAERVISTFSDKAAFEIIYPDGSKISYDTRRKDSEIRSEIEKSYQEEVKDKLKKVRLDLDKNKNMDTYKPVNIGYEETIIDDGITYAYDNLGWREGEWSFESGLSYSKIYLYTEFELGSDGVSTIKYVRGGQSSYGIVNIANSTGSVISRFQSQGEELPAEARNEVVFNVSGSFGASFLNLSLSVEPGMNWTQYIIFRLYDTEIIDGEYVAKYEWYAADYK